MDVKDNYFLFCLFLGLTFLMNRDPLRNVFFSWFCPLCPCLLSSLRKINLPFFSMVIELSLENLFSFLSIIIELSSENLFLCPWLLSFRQQICFHVHDNWAFFRKMFPCPWILSILQRICFRVHDYWAFFSKFVSMSMIIELSSENCFRVHEFWAFFREFVFVSMIIELSSENLFPCP